MKKLFGQRASFGRKEKPSDQEVNLDIVLARKEDTFARLNNEERSFEARRQAIQRSLVDIEKHEIMLREQEINEKKEEFNQISSKNKSHQEKVKEQLKILETKLEEHKMIHRQNEDKLQIEIDELSMALKEVQKSLESRKLAFGEEIPSPLPSAPMITLDMVDGRTRSRLGSEGSNSPVRSRLSSTDSPVRLSSTDSTSLKSWPMLQYDREVSTRSSLMVNFDEEEIKADQKTVQEEEDEEEKDDTFESDTSFKTAEEGDVVD